MVRRPPQGHCSTLRQAQGRLPNVCWWSVATPVARRGGLGMGAFTGRCLSAGDGVETGSAVTSCRSLACGAYAPWKLVR